MEILPQYLYHYTSIEALSLIIKNKAIRFTSLGSVDDLSEGTTTDFNKVGQWFIVSCWTDNANESIPLWNMYSSKMKGVRIKLPIFPFAQEGYKSNGESYTINAVLSDNGEKKELDFVFYFPQMKLYPVEYVSWPIEINLFNRKIDNGKEIFNFNHDNIGRFKNKTWSFQNEWRYKIVLLSKKLADVTMKSFQSEEERDKTLQSIIGKQTGLLQFFDMSIEEDALNSMEILLGPCCDEGEKIIREPLKIPFTTRFKRGCQIFCVNSLFAPV